MGGHAGQMRHLGSVRRVVMKGELSMGRALSRYVPLDMAILSVIEFALSFMVIHFMLDTPSLTWVQMEAAVSLGSPGNGLAAALAFIVGGASLISGCRHREFYLQPKRLLSTVCLATIIAFPIFF